MTKFTTGKWMIDAFRYDRPYIAVRSGEQTICMIGCVGDMKEKEANSRLIAAAPEMYELLKEYQSEELASGSNPERADKVRKLFRRIEKAWYELTRADLEEICNE